MVTGFDFYASQPSYERHLRPIAVELEARGHDVAVYSGREEKPWGPPLPVKRRESARVAVCAALIDAERLVGQRTVYVEHGAGQTYVGRVDGYSGAPGYGDVVLFIGPGEHVAQRWRASYPHVPAVSVGCPALDQHLGAADDPDDQGDDGEDDEDGDEHRPIVAISSHWRCFVCHETMPAIDHYTPAIADLVASQTVRVLGHAHPRYEQHIQELWAALGVPFEPDPDRVLAQADLLVCDNSSLMYEAAALDIPVLALNLPSYRRDVEHGLRFWSHVPGKQCSEPRYFANELLDALDDPLPYRMLRRRAAAHVYAYRDGSSTRRAVDAIEALGL